MPVDGSGPVLCPGFVLRRLTVPPTAWKRHSAEWRRLRRRISRSHDVVNAADHPHRFHQIQHMIGLARRQRPSGIKPPSVSHGLSRAQILSKEEQMQPVNLELSSSPEAQEGEFHLDDYLQRIGVRQISPATSPFDPGYDPLTLRGHLQQSSHLMSILKISMACWIIANESATRGKVAAARDHG